MGTKGPAEQGALTVLRRGRRARPARRTSSARSRRRSSTSATRSAPARSIKLVGNNWVLWLVESLAETIALAEGLGIDPAKFLERIEGGALFAPYAKLKGEAMIERAFEPSFPL